MKNYSVISFSGGKDSTCLLLMMLEKGMDIDYILFCDTGMEFPEMYEHIKKVDKYISEKYGKHVTVIKSERTFEYYATEYEKVKGLNKGKHGYGWPTMMNRWCTKALKTSVVRKFLRAHGMNDSNTKMYIGIAADEPKRIKGDVYPLFEWGVTEADALQFCYDHGFDWGGLYKTHSRLSCWCCPLQSLEDMKVLYRDFPQLWKKLEELNRKIINISNIENSYFFEFKQRRRLGPKLSDYAERFRRECEAENAENKAIRR